MTRRDALKVIVVSSLAPSLIPCLIEDVPATALKSLCSGRLAFVNLHTQERLQVKYLNKRGRFDRKALAKLNHLFRCYYDEKAYRIDPHLYLLLDAVRTKLHAGERTYQLLSGYRSPQYNQYLRKNGHGVARNSYHLKGMAADVCLEGVSLSDLGRTAAAFKVGGVGRYNDFIHMDVGPVRRW
ncbi:YcbK family protein [Desulfoferrobacter suflitae]|uniref:YcbK family protein n=1 Tax=Desulfoferrobacter suflitae TaxID=2865782 RepID=UPI002164B4B5|nr:DUF882 domain-containing protein [Desulfoferrobacter suflitae]MCK8601207.1 DUF882 domain-containing protein [Desulfoferrobacter suflitae]